MLDAVPVEAPLVLLELLELLVPLAAEDAGAAELPLVLLVALVDAEAGAAVPAVAVGVVEPVVVPAL